MMFSTLFKLLSVLIIASNGMLSAAVIADYRFLNLDVTSADAEPNSTASLFADNGSVDWGFSAGRDNAFARSTATTDSQAAADLANDYFSFTVTPSAGFQMDLASLTFDTIHNYTEGSVTNGDSMFFFIRSSLDAFVTDISPTYTEAFVDSQVGTPRSLDLSAPAFQGLTNPIEFRFYVYDNNFDLNSGARLDNVVLNGQVAVPEPSTIVSACICLLGLGLGVRRHRQGKIQSEVA